MFALGLRQPVGERALPAEREPLLHTWGGCRSRGRIGTIGGDPTRIGAFLISLLALAATFVWSRQKERTAAAPERDDPTNRCMRAAACFTHQRCSHRYSIGSTQSARQPGASDFCV